MTAIFSILLPSSSRIPAAMSDFLHSLVRDTKFITDSHAPVDLDGAHPVPSLLTQKLEDIEQLAGDDTLPFTLKDVPAYVDALKNLSSGIDDRKLLLEKVLVLMSRLPQGSLFATRLQQSVIDLLYKDLPHPPSSYLSWPASVSPATNTAVSLDKNVVYAFRAADGSGYNPLFPSLGKAGTPYARSVPSANFTPISSLPDAGLVFDTLLRRDKFVPHPGGISSLFFAFADLIIHSIFNTDHSDPTINQSSSYLDLSILYGSKQSEVDSVRRKDGTGRLHEDVFADSRLLFMPPSTCALLVLLSRNHNYIASKILDINERRTYISPPPSDEKLRLDQDEEIFQRARLVNCGFFMQIILGDYVGAILGLVRDGRSWRLNPLQATREIDHEVSPRGEGNVVSIEFNLLYRWHATLSEKDAEWTENEFKTIFEGKDLDTISERDFGMAAQKYMDVKSPVTEWVFDGAKRDKHGRFNDGDLAKILQNATEWPAGAYGARSIPAAMRIIEIMGIEQARQWGTCSLNEFRKFMGLKPYSSFAEWNPDPQVHLAAAALYHDIENLELHVGMQAEETKTPVPGAGLCPGYTISRAILADAVCLTRGDRFLTTECTPFNLTSWGYQDCQFNIEDGSYGGMLTKLLFRTLPEHYPARSAYAHFPFLVPDYIKTHLAQLPDDPVSKYKWTRPPVPKGFVVVDKYEDVTQVIKEHHKFVAGYKTRLFNIIKHTVDRNLVGQIIFSDDKNWGEYFIKTTKELIQEKSVGHVGSKDKKYVDIVKDVINLLPIHWIATEIAGLPLKTIQNPKGVFREQELYAKFADICRYVFLTYEPDNNWTLRERAVKTFNMVTNDYIQVHLNAFSSSFSPKDAIIRHTSMPNDHSYTFLKQLFSATGHEHTREELAADIFAAVIPTAAHFSQAIAHAVDFYLDVDRRSAREEIVKLAAEESYAKVLEFVREALRLNPPVSGVYRTAAIDSYIGPTKIHAGERVFASIVKANLDPSVFGSESTTATFNRLEGERGILGLEEHGLLSSKFFEKIVPRVFGIILSLKNISRAPDQSGKFNKFTQNCHGTQEQLYISSQGLVIPWPESLIIQYKI